MILRLGRGTCNPEVPGSISTLAASVNTQLVCLLLVGSFCCI